MDPATEMTSQEVAAMKEFRQRVEDLIPKLKTDIEKQDLNLLRFLRARELHLGRAEDMLRKHMKWRKEFEIDYIFEKKFPPQFEIDFPVKLCGRDREGYLVLAAQLGRWDFRAAMEGGYRDVFVQFVIQWLERYMDMGRQVSTANKVYSQSCVIFDFDQFSYTQLASKTVVSMILELVRVFESNYPEILRCVWIVNAPTVFQVLWGLIRPILTERTTQKIRIFGGNKQKWRADLISIVSEDNIPSIYSGSNTTCSNWKYDGDMNIAALLPTVACLPNSAEKKEVVVGASQLYTVEVEGTEGRKIHWQFKTDTYDITFRVDYEDVEDIVEPLRVDSHWCTQKGTITCEKSGRYTLVFDNTYSSWTSKSLTYYVWTS